MFLGLVIWWGLVASSAAQSIGFAPYYGNQFSNPFTTPMLGYGMGTMPFGYPSYNYPYNYPYAGYGAQYMGGYGFGGYPYGPYGGFLAGGYGAGMGGLFPASVRSSSDYGSTGSRSYGSDAHRRSRLKR